MPYSSLGESIEFVGFFRNIPPGGGTTRVTSRGQSMSWEGDTGHCPPWLQIPWPPILPGLTRTRNEVCIE